MAIAKMYQRLYPSMHTKLAVTRPWNYLLKKTKIGFVSSWFRTHSVGKLIHKTIASLDRYE